MNLPVVQPYYREVKIRVSFVLGLLNLFLFFIFSKKAKIFMTIIAASRKFFDYIIMCEIIASKYVLKDQQKIK